MLRFGHARAKQNRSQPSWYNIPTSFAMFGIWNPLTKWPYWSDRRDKTLEVIRQRVWSETDKSISSLNFRWNVASVQKPDRPWCCQQELLRRPGDNWQRHRFWPPDRRWWSQSFSDFITWNLLVCQLSGIGLSSSRFFTLFYSGSKAQLGSRIVFYM